MFCKGGIYKQISFFSLQNNACKKSHGKGFVNYKLSLFFNFLTSTTVLVSFFFLQNNAIKKPHGKGFVNYKLSLFFNL